jgi:small-conductance mechanosensitive channel
VLSRSDVPLEGIQIGGLYVRLLNQKVFTANTANFVSHVARRFEYVVRIRYSDDAAQAIKIIKDLIEAQPMALKNPEPQVFEAPKQPGMELFR